MNLIKNLLGGRPMRKQGALFVDRVSGESVNHYIDTLGRHWMAASAWAFFRVAKEKS